jgi:hypothetical protein
MSFSYFFLKGYISFLRLPLLRVYLLLYSAAMRYSCDCYKTWAIRGKFSLDMRIMHAARRMQGIADSGVNGWKDGALWHCQAAAGAVYSLKKLGNLNEGSSGWSTSVFMAY